MRCGEKLVVVVIDVRYYVNGRLRFPRTQIGQNNSIKAQTHSYPRTSSHVHIYTHIHSTHLAAQVDAHTDHSPNSRIHALRIAAAGQHGNAFALVSATLDEALLIHFSVVGSAIGVGCDSND